MQPCFFALAGVIPADEAIDHIKASVEKRLWEAWRTIVERNFAAIDASLAALARVDVPAEVTSHRNASRAPCPPTLPTSSPGSRPG